MITWTGDTHEETDVLPGNRQNKDSRHGTSSLWKDARDKTSLIVKEIVDTRLTLIGKELGRGDDTRLQCYTAEV